MPTLTWLEITGFRSFSVTQRLEFTNSLSLIWGGNSQGKTSIAEAVEFLLTGHTVRQTLLGGEATEHYASLRCVHHPREEPVVVAAGLIDTLGVERRIERTLDTDLARGQNRTSTLTIDGVAASGLTGVGLLLAEPPLRAPVLFRHSVRYALSARPSDRLAYFKALLELTDLDQLTAAISTAVSAISHQPSALERDLATCLADATLGPGLATLREPPVSRVGTREAMVRAAGSALVGLGETAPADAAFPEQHAAQLDAALDALDQRRFDFAAWRPSSDRPGLSAPSLSGTKRLNAAASAVDAETARLTALYEAVLAVPELGTLDAPADCPVCGTTEALTPQRVATLRSKLAETEQFRAARSAALAELAAIGRDLASARAAVVASPPSIVDAPMTVIAEATATLSLILGTEVDLCAAMHAATELRASAGLATTAIDTAAVAMTKIEELAHEGRAAPTDEFERAAAAAVDAVAVVAARRSEFVAAAKVVLMPAREALDAQVGTSAYRALVRLVRDCDGLTFARRRSVAVAQVRAEYTAALRDIERAKLAVLKAKFVGMSDEIKRWWDLLRPDEPVAFHRAAPRGQGLRAMSLEASLKGSEDVEEIRDALGILSDSQLNALGLSAFLARACLQQTPFIVLDDPVQSGDEAHRDTFIDHVVPALLDAGLQIIVTTFDHSFRSLLTKAYALDGFQVDLDEPTTGSVIVHGTHSAAALLNEAKGFLQEGQSLRAAGAWKLRVAAEAVAKEILVKRRTETGERASLADYAKWTLEKLVPELQQHLDEDKARRWWSMLSERVSPGSHDDAPPERATLKIVYDGLKVALRAM